MSVWQWILSIVLFIFSLGVLIVIHELGHFSMAKLFNVYCQEFSIGFGPALLHKRKKGKETSFSIRAVPLGGYVSMYGEGVELEDGVNIPEERSLEGIKRWKKAIIVSAGIILNAVLALVLFSISDLCFPQTKITTRTTINTSSEAYSLGIKENDGMYIIGPAKDETVVINDTIDGVTYQDYFYLVDDDVYVESSDKHYVAAFKPNGNKNEPLLSDSLFFFQVDTTGQMANLKVFQTWKEKGIVLTNYPDIRLDTLQPGADTTFKINLGFYKYLGADEEGDMKYEETPTNYALTMSTVESGSSFAWKDLGISLKTYDYWAPFGDRVANVFIDFGNASVSVIKGIGSLFTGGISNMTGIVGILNTSAQVLNQYTFSTYLYLWGLISVNLAIFNLLPFPGLDGWALLVTAIEGSVNAVKRGKAKRQGVDSSSISEWKIPMKIKNIVSYIGLGLLFLLMIVIVALDVVRWIGVI